MSCSIEDLPNELINRIFNNLDIDTIILFSLTCKRFLNCLNNYNEYEINFESISKIKFDSICRLINPLNIKSLILSDNDKTPGQIKLFEKLIPLKELKHLKSLKLIQINENDLENFLKNFLNNNSLNCFEIEYRKYFTLLNSSTISILNQILSLKTLKKVCLDMKDCFQCPLLSYSIQHLTLFNLNLNQFLQIIEKSNQFQTIILKNLSMKNSDEKICSKLIHLKSFEIIQSELIFDKIQFLINLMTELIYLKLEGSTNYFLFEKLISLKKFEFFIKYSSNEFNFQEFKNLNLNYFINSNEIYFYSIPLINHYFKYSNLLIKQNQFYDYVYYLELNLQDLQIMNFEKKIFLKLNYLKLTISDQCSLDCFELLSKLIYLENLIEIILIICSRGSYLNLMMKNFLNLVKNLPNLNSIEIFNRWHGLFSFININYFCSMIPINIKHLDIDIADIEHIKILIEQLKHITSFKFKFSFDKSIFIKDILQWLTNKQINSTYQLDIHYLSIWISQQTNLIHSNKRIKL